MTKEHWLTIATIISSFIGPLVAVYFQSRLTQPKPTPEANQPKNRIQRIGGWLKERLKPLGLVYLALVLNVISLASLVFSTEPVSRMVVLAIAAYVGMIVLLILVMFISWIGERMLWHLSYTDELSSRTVQLADVIGKEVELNTARQELLVAVAERVHSMKAEQMKKQPDKLGTLIDTVKKMLKG